MKVILSLLAVCFFSSFSNACPEISNCQIKKNNLRMKMNVIASNMQNVNTTRTPEGGPYQRMSLNCDKNDICQDERDASFISKYEPNHPDADRNGYVKYPNINMMREMNEMLEATRDWEDLSRNCH